MDLLPFSPKGLLSIWGREEFPWEPRTIKTFWVDPAEAISMPNFSAEMGYRDINIEPFFGSLYRTWDPGRDSQVTPVEVDHQFESRRKYVPRSWKGTKYGADQTIIQSGLQACYGRSWSYFFEITAIQASSEVPWPWTNQAEPMVLSGSENSIYSKDNSVVLGDMGTILFLVNSRGKFKTDFSCG